MAVTKGHGNPDWTRDEVILALDLYLACEGKMPGPSDPRVVALSTALRLLPIHTEASKNERFRNPAGVAFKLQNIRQVATGVGLGNVSAIDKSVWTDLGGGPQRVHDLATRIRAEGIAGEVPSVEVEALDDDEEFVEGRVLTVLHKVRERHPKLRRELLKHRHVNGGLSCDACGDKPKARDKALGEAGFEGHHVVPLAAATERVTKVKDMALLCATCHRIIHRAMHIKRAWVTVADLKAMLGT